jgi:uncharacterized cupredoxin-like copper-binding protein
VPVDVIELETPCGRPPRLRTPRWKPSLAAALLLLGGCSAASPAASGSVVNVTLHDFKIETSSSASGTGDVVFQVANRAPVTHEFVVVRSDLPADQLPIGSDGLSVDEDQLRPVGEIGEVETGTTQTLAIHLAPGRYVFFCNLEGHYLGGMHGSLEVSGDASGS